MYLILNNKMYLDINNLNEYIEDLKKLNCSKTKLIVAPSYPLIPYFKSNNYSLCSQDVSSKINGSFTGEVSASYLKALKVEYSLVNHYERYTYFKEDFDECISKINNLHKYGITPVLCITTSVNSQNKIIDKINNICDKIDMNKDIIIAYESKEAMEKEIITDYQEIQNNIEVIKKHILERYNKNIPILYGGFVNKETINKLLDIKQIDGFIMGKDSINIESIKKVIMEVENG